MLWDMIGIIAAILTTFGFLPQAVKMLKTHSSGDVSALTLSQFTFGVFLWMLYGIHIKNPIIIGANAISFLGLSATLGLYFKYR